MYQDVEVCQFSRVNRIIETTSNALRTTFDSVNLAPFYVVKDWYMPYKNKQETFANDKVNVNCSKFTT